MLNECDSTNPVALSTNIITTNHHFIDELRPVLQERDPSDRLLNVSNQNQMNGLDKKLTDLPLIF